MRLGKLQNELLSAAKEMLELVSNDSEGKECYLCEEDHSILNMSRRKMIQVGKSLEEKGLIWMVFGQEDGLYYFVPV